MRESVDVRTVDIQFREIQHIAVCVLAGGHDARDSIGHIHIDRDAGEVFLLTDLHLAVRTHTADEEHVKPVADEFGSVLGGQSILTQQSLYRVDVLKGDIRSCALQIGVKCEVVLGQTAIRYALHNRCTDRIRGRLQKAMPIRER